MQQLAAVGTTNHDRVLAALLSWFETAQRDYPWRRAADPFLVLVAEVMLQRTTPGHVAPVYQLFERVYGSAERLAAADRAEVEALLRPLGLLRRAELLHLLAEEIAANWRGRPPEDYASLIRLPSVGPYTARAVMCLAYGRDLAMPDVNAIRVASRAFGIDSDRRRPHADKGLWRRMDDLVPVGDARRFNLALIDLGSLVCRRRRPRCCRCPLASHCATGKGASTDVQKGLYHR